MVDPLTLVVSMPPSTNSLFANVPGKGRVKTGLYKAWITEAGYQVNRQPKWAFVEDVALTITVGPRDKRADISNRIKAVEDLLVRHGVLEDDNQVVRVTAQWGDVRGCQIDVEAA